MYCQVEHTFTICGYEEQWLVTQDGPIWPIQSSANPRILSGFPSLTSGIKRIGTSGTFTFWSSGQTSEQPATAATLVLKANGFESASTGEALFIISGDTAASIRHAPGTEGGIYSSTAYLKEYRHQIRVTDSLNVDYAGFKVKFYAGSSLPLFVYSGKTGYINGIAFYSSAAEMTNKITYTAERADRPVYTSSYSNGVSSFSRNIVLPRTEEGPLLTARLVSNMVETEPDDLGVDSNKILTKAIINACDSPNALKFSSDYGNEWDGTDNNMAIHASALLASDNTPDHYEDWAEEGTRWGGNTAPIPSLYSTTYTCNQNSPVYTLSASLLTIASQAFQTNTASSYSTIANLSDPRNGGAMKYTGDAEVQVPYVCLTSCTINFNSLRNVLVYGFPMSVNVFVTSGTSALIASRSIQSIGSFTREYMQDLTTVAVNKIEHNNQHAGEILDNNIYLATSGYKINFHVNAGAYYCLRCRIYDHYFTGYGEVVLAPSTASAQTEFDIAGTYDLKLPQY